MRSSRPVLGARRAGGPGLGEGGAVLVIIAVMFPLVVAVGGLGINYSSLWSERRELLTATDAGALAGAMRLAERGTATDAVTACRDLITQNHPGATATCSVQADNRTVVATASARAQTVLLPQSFTPGTARAKSVARSGPPRGILGARPISLCWANQAYQNWQLDVQVSGVGNPNGYSFDMNAPCPSSTTDATKVEYHRNFEKIIATGRIGESMFVEEMSRGRDTLTEVCAVVDVREEWTNQDRNLITPYQNLLLPVAVFAINPPECNGTPGSGRTTLGVVDFVVVEFLEVGTFRAKAAPVRVQFHELTVSGVCCRGGDSSIGARVVEMCPNSGCVD